MYSIHVSPCKHWLQILSTLNCGCLISISHILTKFFERNRSVILWLDFTFCFLHWTSFELIFHCILALPIIIGVQHPVWQRKAGKRESLKARPLKMQLILTRLQRVFPFPLASRLGDSIMMFLMLERIQKFPMLEWIPTSRIFTLNLTSIGKSKKRTV